MAGKTTKKDRPFDCAASYTITSKLSGKAVTACGETEVRMFSPTGEADQQWMLEETQTGAYRLLSKATGKALDIILAGENNGAQLHQWESAAAPTQGWKLERTEDGCCKIKSAVSGKCLDIVDISLLDDARLQIWEDLDGENQKWMLTALAAPKPARKPRAPRRESAALAEPAKENSASSMDEPKVAAAEKTSKKAPAAQTVPQAVKKEPAKRAAPRTTSKTKPAKKTAEKPQK